LAEYKRRPCATHAPFAGAWEAFQARATTAGDLDTLLGAHATYLATLLRQCLLGEEAQGLRDVLGELLGSLLGLGPLVARFREQVGVGGCVGVLNGSRGGRCCRQGQGTAVGMVGAGRPADVIEV
jgi:hypothetical protein